MLKNHRRATKRLHHLIIAGALLLSVGWAQKQVTFSGFLGDYSGLEPSKKLDGAFVYRHPDRKLREYTNVLIEPVQIVYHEKAKGQAVNEEELQNLAEYFRQRAVEAIQDAYPVVETPGPLVSRVRAAITDVVPTDTKKAVLGQAAPRAAGMAVGVPVPLGIPIGIGEASMEAELLDSETGERIAAIVDKKKLGRGIPVISVFDFSRYSEFGAAKDAFDQWAKWLRGALDTAHSAKGAGN